MSQINKNNGNKPMRGKESQTFVRAATGAGIGAVIGAFLIPGFGAAIGGALGGAIGGFSGDREDSDAGR